MGLTLVHALDARLSEDLWGLYQEEWWTRGRTLADVRAMLAQSGVVLGLQDQDTGRLAGFARVLTDGVYKALILDVIVAEAWRGAGVGRRLLDAVLSHPALVGVAHFELYCLEEMVPFYEQWGFALPGGGLRFMRKG